MPANSEKYSDDLRQAGLKVTQTRLGILAALSEMGGHCSADEVYRHLSQGGNQIPRGTVFKVVADLSAKGILMVTDAGPGRTLYEYADHWHHHFVCRRCNMIMDVPCIEGKKPCLLPPVAIPATIDEAQVIFRGICDACNSQA